MVTDNGQTARGMPLLMYAYQSRYRQVFPGNATPSVAAVFTSSRSLPSQHLYTLSGHFQTHSVEAYGDPYLDTPTHHHMTIITQK